MRSEFCNWFEKRHGKNPHHFTEDYADYTYLKHETGKAWQHQQSKIDELQKRVDALIQKYKDEDRELKLIDEWEKSQIYGLVASELEQALKGESNG